MAKVSYKALCAEVAQKSNRKEKSAIVSKADLTGLTLALLNDTEYAAPVVVTEADKPVTKTTNPSKRYRDSLKPMLKEFGIDKNELDKVQEVSFGKEHAAALMELAMTVQKDYLTAGRKLMLPMTAEDESKMYVSIDTVPEKVEATRKIVETAPGKYESVPTGRTVRTTEHAVIKSANRVPAWLKKDI